MEITGGGGGGVTSTPWNGNSKGVEGLKQKWGGGGWIVSGTTQYYNIYTVHE